MLVTGNKVEKSKFKDMEENYLESVLKQFKYYKHLGDQTFKQLNDQELIWQFHSESNSIAIIVKHLWGNMRSRWTDFLSTDGEKEWRNRDTEFEADLKQREDILAAWEEGWSCLFEALHSITTTDFQETIYIRNMGHTIVEAINRQLAHYAYHVGQIVFIGRVLKNETWQSLSIPKGASKTYNDQKFALPKRKEHFTSEFLEEE